MEQKTLGQVAWEAHLEALPARANRWSHVADAVIAAHEARRWRPIESAPKDGYVLIYGPMTDGGSYQERCKWYTSKHITLPDGGLWPVTFMSGFGAPTHWAECLPAPPKEGE